MSVALKHKQSTHTTSDVSHAPDLKVVKGKATRKRSVPASSLKAAFYTAIVCVVMLAGVAGFRVYMASQASVAAIEAAKIKSEISEAYTETGRLELKQSILAQPDRIKLYAQTELGMGPAVAVSHINIGDAPTEVALDLPDDAFNNAHPGDTNKANSLVKIVRDIFVPSEAGAALVTAP